MTALPDGMRGKVLAVAIAITIICVLDFGIVAPLFAYYGGNAQKLQDRLDVVQRYHNATQDLARLRAEAKKTNTENVLLTGASDAIAAASLQSTLKDLIEKNGAKLASAQTLPPGTESNFRRVGIRVAFSGDMTLLTTVLLGVETSHPVLTVSNFDLHGGSADGDGGDMLSVTMDVYGFRSR